MDLAPLVVSGLRPDAGQLHHWLVEWTCYQLVVVYSMMTPARVARLNSAALSAYLHLEGLSRPGGPQGDEIRLFHDNLIRKTSLK